MKSRRNEKFRKKYDSLPDNVKVAAVKSYAQWADFMKNGTFYKGLNWELIDADDQTYTVRTGLGYRAMCEKVGDTYVWFWIGSKGDWERDWG